VRPFGTLPNRVPILEKDLPRMHLQIRTDGTPPCDPYWRTTPVLEGQRDLTAHIVGGRSEPRLKRTMFGSRAGGWIHRKMHCRSQSLLWRRLFADRVATTAAVAATTVEAAIATATASATAAAATPATAGHNGGRGMGKTAAAVAPSITVPPPHRLPRLQKLSHPLRLDRAHAMAVATARAVASAAMAATTSAVRWHCVSCTRPKHVERGRRTVSALSPFVGIGMRTDASMRLATASNYQ
jgi:hypothetical protein